MKKLIVISIAMLLSLTFSSPLLAVQIIVGPQEGFLGPDSFYVVGNISVELGDSLTILPPSTFIFNGSFEFTIKGYLQAIGNSAYSIEFKPNTGLSWKGLHFQNSASDSSKIKYCSFTGATLSAVSCNYCSPTISHCSFVDNHATTGNGGGIMCNCSNSTISYCTISSNSCPVNSQGCGIYCDSSNVNISSCTISGNHGDYYISGIGIYFSSSNATISSCTISGNHGDYYISGVGIYFSNSNSNINNCIISGNYTYNGVGGGIACSNTNITINDSTTITGNSASHGGGIFCQSNSNSTINNSLITVNSAGYNGGGIFCESNSNSTINNSLITVNSASYGGGIYCNNSDPSINNCIITGNSAGSAGGILLENQCNAIIDSCTITGNSASSNGGGIAFNTNSIVSINNSAINNNSASSIGGGFSFSTSSLNLTNCTVDSNISNGARAGGINLENNSNLTLNSCSVSHNSATNGEGGGIYCNNSIATINSSDINYNTAYLTGGGISCDNSGITLTKTVVHANIANGAFMSGGGIGLWNNSDSCYIRNCTITGNSSTTGTGGGIYCSENSSFNLLNSIIEGNTGFGGIHIDGANNSSLTYSDFNNNQNGNCIGYPPAGFGSITGYNFNGDSCDIYHNIFLAPQFVLPDSDNFNLQATSPCIDAGDPLCQIDPDFTFADIGAFYCYQPGVSYFSVSPYALGFGTVNLGDQDTLSINIYSIGNGTLILRNIYTTDPVFTTNFDSNDSLLAVGDTLELKVFFTPVLATNYEDTLFIVNNSQVLDSLIVNIQGAGFAPPEVIITLTPVNPPIIIPANGGSFDYTLEIVNQETTVTTFDAWINATLPNGAIYGPIINRSLSLLGGATLSRTMTQNVPASAPIGVYSYNGYVGDIESTTIWDSSSFNFTKSGVDAAGFTGDWDIFGWDEATATNMIITSEYSLHSPSPNPFNPTTILTFSLPASGEISLIVYDIQGREAARLVDEWKQAGTYEVTFNASKLASGIYFAHLFAADFQQTQKLLLIK